MVPTESGKVRPASCRDKGRSGVDEGALCLSWWGCDRLASGNPDHSSCHQDKHKAPSLLHVHPLSLQDGGRHSHSFPDSVGKHHQGDRSNGQGLFFKLNLALTTNVGPVILRSAQDLFAHRNRPFAPLRVTTHSRINDHESRWDGCAVQPNRSMRIFLA